eukprot:TRINITY_DN20755_c0_g1_i1.p1 TRINITY_DN20755_c0_g1~~TRINITY_DN20755_c0_g1_i1.p1  ORF type:complete len:442 (-),score=86.96 TRINITY_DN20755_c0_g1_i1:76-1401(-)
MVVSMEKLLQFTREEAPLGVTGTLLLRFSDGFSRNVIFANQLDLLQRFAGLGQNSAQQAAKFLSATCSLGPLVIGAAATKQRWHLPHVVLLGCTFEAMGIAGVACGAAASVGADVVLMSLFVFYAVGYGAITSALPVVGAAEVAPHDRAFFMQNFFACLAAGSMLGIAVAGVAETLSLYVEGYMIACFVLSAGTVAFSMRRSVASSSASSGAVEVASRRVRFAYVWQLVALVPFYMAYLQWTTSWYVQTTFMDRRVAGLRVPACFPQLVERLGALLGLVLLRRFCSERSSPPSIAARFAGGCLLSGAALAASALVEQQRRAAPRLVENSTISSLHVAWQAPQFLLIAAAEAVIFPAQTEWAAGSSTLVGLACATQAAAAVLLGLALPHLQAWVPQEGPDAGRYDLYFLTLGGGCLLTAVLFLLIPKSAWASPLVENSRDDL